MKRLWGLSLALALLALPFLISARTASAQNLANQDICWLGRNGTRDGLYGLALYNIPFELAQKLYSLGWAAPLENTQLLNEYAYINGGKVQRCYNVP